MTDLLILLSVLVLLCLAFVAAVTVLKRRTVSSTQSAELRFERRELLLSPTEQVFYHALRQAVGETAAISLKTGAAELLKSTGERWAAGRNKIIQKHVDFVLFDPQSTRILCAIELDDSSHQRQRRIQRDAELDAIFTQAGVPLIRIPAARSYDAATLRTLIAPLLPAAPQAAGVR